MTHIAAFVAPVLTEKKDAYLAIAERMSSFFKENGALRVVECWGADIPEGKLTSFPQSVQKKDTETIVLSWIEWPSKGHGGRRLGEDGPGQGIDGSALHGADGQSAHVLGIV